MADEDTSSEVETISRDEVSVRPPRLFKVLLLNDDYTTMNFVVAILETVFRKSPAEAVRVMLAVHNRGQGVCGVYPKQIAEAKLLAVHERAQAEGFPLRCVMDEA